MKIKWLAICYFIFSAKAHGQELEARAYANLPVNMNVVAAVYAYSNGHVLADASLPVEDFNMKTHNLALAYVHSFALNNKLARIQIAAPLVRMQGQLRYAGQDTSGERTGLGDMRVRLGINLIGSPALAKKDFGKYTQKTIVGISLITSVPTGLYYTDKRINIGNNRWAFKPELGASRRFGQIYADGYLGWWFYTKNSDFLITKVLEQRPLFTTQLHGSYYFKKGMMIGLDGNWFSGGKTYINEVESGAGIDHLRVGVTWALPIAGKHVIRFQFHTTAYTNAGYDYNFFALGYQYVFF
ncbi:hypothetical protein A4D02_21905 [Niastella koreensis]|uniref:Transporter n=2 Tax=Niastella koreensis TaxID=354356 RepID=G8TGQ5_NIAKG|nr:transporter [Niastella koreensis]AEV98497.1 hypothetical protein Niako_2142 [Niastella koreensis GR20-10]OQP53059.1 hypothetical protein A4D02_21905 [Niastella koreensis]